MGEAGAGSSSHYCRWEQRCLRSTCVPSLCKAHLPRQYLAFVIPHNSKRTYSGSMRYQMPTPKFRAWTISCVHPWEIRTSFYLYCTLGRIKYEDKQGLKRLWLRRNLRPNRLHKFLSSLLFIQRSETGLKVCRVPQCLSYISLLMPSVPCRPEDLEVAPTSQDTKWAGIVWAKIKNVEEK